MRLRKNQIFMIAATLLMAGCTLIGGKDTYSRTEPVMGTFVQVKVVSSALSREEMEKAVDGAMDIAHRLEKKLSAYDPSSEVNRLNEIKTLAVSPDLLAVLQESKRISRITDGEFDVTVAPLLKADGFYAAMPVEISDKIPDGTGGIGWRNITVRLDGKSVVLRKGAWVDLSGIAKGYIVDRMSDFLREQGFEGVMVNAGGDIYCTSKGGDLPWRIGIRKPASESVIVRLKVMDMAVATSGDYENVVTDKSTGAVMSHIIDPSDGEARVEVPSSVTVIAPTCAAADALATGMMAMGPEAAIQLANSLESVEVIVIQSPGGRNKITFSSGVSKYVVER